MADQKVTLLDTLGSIDRSTDYLYIVDTSTDTSNKMTVNGVLGISSAPLGIYDAQSPTNKSFDNSNDFTLRSDRFILQDNADTTKQANFQLSSISAAMTRTFTLPNRSGTLVTLNGNQTFTGIITASGSVLDQPTITNPTITTDAINEFTANTGVNIDGLVIKDALLPAGNIQPLNLVTGTGTSWVSQSWVPTFANFTLGNGTINNARYIQIGKDVFFNLQFTLGSTSIMGTAPTFSLPVTARNTYSTDNTYIGSAIYRDSGIARYIGLTLLNSTTSAGLFVSRVDSSYAFENALTSTVPMTWATDDVVNVMGHYEAA